MLKISCERQLFKNVEELKFYMAFTW